jgi:hypothetical protein
MGPVKYAPHAVEYDAYTRSFAFTDFSAAGHEQGLDIAPRN